MSDEKALEVLFESKEFELLESIGKEIYKRKQEFDIIELFQNLFNENAWSKLFSYLLNSSNNHGLKQLFLREWFSNCKNDVLNNFTKLLPSTETSEVKTITEWYTETNRRIDIMLLIKDENNRTQSVIGIENKLFSNEGDNQLKDYQNSIAKKYPEVKNKILIYLTPNGIAAKTSKRNIECPCVAIGYESIRETCSNIINTQKQNHVELLLKSMDVHISKLSNKISMEQDIKTVINTIYLDPTKREAIKLLLNNIPNVSNVFEKLKREYENSKRFYLYTYHSIEFKLHTKRLDELTEDLNIGFCYMLHSKKSNPDIGDDFVMRLMMVVEPKETSKEEISKLQKYFSFPDSLNDSKDWWHWRTIWTGDNYKLEDLGEKDKLGLQNLLNDCIESTYDKLHEKIILLKNKATKN